MSLPQNLHAKARHRLAESVIERCQGQLPTKYEVQVGGGVTRAKGATHLLAPSRSDCPFRRSALRAHRESDHGKLPQTAYPATSDTNVPFAPPGSPTEPSERSRAVDASRWSSLGSS